MLKTSLRLEIYDEVLFERHQVAEAEEKYGEADAGQGHDREDREIIEALRRIVKGTDSQGCVTLDLKKILEFFFFFFI